MQVSVLLKFSSLFARTDAQKEAKFLCEIIAPLGGPVVPLVYEKVKQSYGLIFHLSSVYFCGFSFPDLRTSSKLISLTPLSANFCSCSGTMGS